MIFVKRTEKRAKLIHVIDHANKDMVAFDEVEYRTHGLKAARNAGASPKEAVSMVEYMIKQTKKNIERG